MDSNSTKDLSSGSLEIQQTDDGSHTLYRADLNETYHSHKGARGESEYVFIQEGLAWFFRGISAQTCRVLEVGLGTGLNAWLSWKYAEENHRSITYHTLEPLPVPSSIYANLNYASEGPDAEIFQKIHACEWGKEVNLSDRLTLFKYQEKLETFTEQIEVDVVFMDAFAPSKQPEVWVRSNLQKCYDLLISGGFLVTYCAQGQFKRDLKACGFEVSSLPGALGKKEMVRAVKP